MERDPYVKISLSSGTYMTLSHIRIIGAGLIGTSIGLAVRPHGIEVTMIDRDERAQKLASDLVGTAPDSPVDLVIFALPSSLLDQVISYEYQLNPQATFMDIGSVKSKPLADIKSSPLPLSQFVPSHPMAGREMGGAESARGDLFQGRPWIFTALGVGPAHLARACELIELTGASAFEMSVESHDGAVAAISHLPQLVSSLLAKQLLPVAEQWLQLAGAGLRDTTRIAASDANLWREIISMNKVHIKPLLLDLQSDLGELIAQLDSPEEIGHFISEGAQGRARIPGKHGGRARDYTFLPIVIEDKPGQLASLFNECAVAGVNIEDLSIEHSPGQFTGLITLALSSEGASALQAHLSQAGWSVHSPR